MEIAGLSHEELALLAEEIEDESSETALHASVDLGKMAVRVVQLVREQSKPNRDALLDEGAFRLIDLINTATEARQWLDIRSDRSVRREFKRSLRTEMAAIEVVMEMGEGMVESAADHYATSCSSREALIEEGRLGLLEAIRGFDPSRNTHFSMYAFACIRSRVVAAVQRNHHQIISLDPIDIQALADGEDQGSASEQAVLQATLPAALRQILDSLSPAAAALLRMRFGIDLMRAYTLRQSGEILGVSRETVRRHEHELLKQLRYLPEFEPLREYLTD